MCQAMENDHDFGAIAWKIQAAADDTMITKDAYQDRYLPHFVRELNRRD